VNKHGCSKCELYEACNHVRTDIRVYDPKDKYGYYVTYVGGHAVLTTIGMFSPETLVLCVGGNAVGDIADRPEYEQSKRILYRVLHTWDYFVDQHEFVVLGLRESLLELSK